MIRTILIGASTLAIVGGAAFAQGAEEPLQIDTSKIVDVDLIAVEAPLDATTVTTRDDARLFAVAEFNLADINADGKIDQEEFVAYATSVTENARTQTKNEANTETQAIEGEGDITVVAAADATPAPEVVFAEISEGEKTIDQIKMVEARIANFEEADANNDEKLDETEKAQFAALVTGKKIS